MKTLIPLLLAIALLFSGCSVLNVETGLGEPAKACKIEVFSAEGVLLKTSENPEIMEALSNISDWELSDNPPVCSEKELELAVYQESTLLSGQAPTKPKEFINIMRVILYQGTNCAEVSFLDGAAQGASFPGEILTFHYILPEETSRRLRDLAEGSGR